MPSRLTVTAFSTTWNRLRSVMYLPSNGHVTGLRVLVTAEQDRNPDFLWLSNSFSALYLRGSQEKRLLQGMLLAVPR